MGGGRITINSDESLSSPPAHNKTEDGWFIYNDTQYFINTDTMDMESARAFCKKNFGDLAVITGDSERRFLWKLVLNTEHTHVHPHQKCKISNFYCFGPQQISKGSNGQYYIGMYLNLDKSFRYVALAYQPCLNQKRKKTNLDPNPPPRSWVDDTPVTYTAWEKNEPNFANNDENCVTIYKSMGG